jgi:hypothetical protein
MENVFLGRTRKKQDIVEVDKNKIIYMSRSTLLTGAWKTAGELVSSNGITRYSYCRQAVLKAICHSYQTGNISGLEVVWCLGVGQ